MKLSPFALLALVALTAPAFANVIVKSPTNGETVSSPAAFQATATTSTCSRGVGSMGVYIDNNLEYVVNGASLNTTLTLAAGNHNAVLQEWDNCGGATKTAVPITVVAATKTGVFVTSPANNATIVGSANFVATATTSCSKGVSAMGVYVNGDRIYVQNGAQINDPLNLPAGNDYVVVEEWDGCGGAATSPLTLIVKPLTPSGGSGSGSGPTPIPSTANTLTNLQKDAWLSWGQEAPLDNDCAAPCPGVAWSMNGGITWPSLSGDSTEFSLGGTTPYSDVLFYNQLLGTASTQGIPDSNHTLIPTLHNFVYSTDVYVSDASVTQALEFDVNMFLNGAGMTFGTECRLAGGNEWDIWDNVAAHWVPTGVACNMINQGWNHISLQVSRDNNYNLTFQAITLNGKTAVLNKTYAPFSVPDNWYGVVCGWQMDGNFAQNSFSTYLDNTTFTYW